MTNPTHLDLYVTQWLGSIGPTHNSPDARNLLFIVAPSGSDYTTEGKKYLIEATESHYELWIDTNEDLEDFVDKILYVGTFPVSKTDPNGIVEECVPVIVQCLKKRGF